MNPRFYPWFLLFYATWVSPLGAADLPPAARRRVDFVKDVQPLFARSCYACHGPKRQKNDFRLDEKAAALKGGQLGKAIVPGKSAESPLIRYVAGLDPDLVMPPDGKRLTAAEVGLLRAWIDQGANWPDTATPLVEDKKDWWSLRPLTRPIIPPLPTAAGRWARTPVDHFILAKLLEKGLRPSPEADRRTLIRRLSFDLLGLPPTPDEVDAFVSDPDPLAYENLVDRYLASPHHGERWARHWLDVAHYGDTHGYDKDKPRPNAWPYRDYVVRALNADKPYERFVKEQIAGDILYPGTADGVTATGFIAAGPWDFIGHAEVPESKIDGQIARHLDRDDMVCNTLNTFASLTVQCARCHHHKFDPVSMEEYYSLQAVFAALDRADRPYDADPEVARRREHLVRRQRELETARQALLARVRLSAGKEWEDLEARIAALARPVPAGERPEFGYHSAVERRQDVVKWVQVDLGRAAELVKVIVVGCHDNFNNIGAGFGFPVRYKIEVSNDPEFQRGVAVVADHTGADAANPGVRPQAVAFAAQTARYIRVTATKLAPRQNDYIFALAELQAHTPDGGNAALGTTVTALDSIEAPVRWARKNLVDGYYYGSRPQAGREEQLARLTERRRTVLATALTAPLQGAWEETERLQQNVAEELARLPHPGLVYAGTIYHGKGTFTGTGPSGGKPRPIHVLHRGDVQSPRQAVEPGTVDLIPGLAPRFALRPDHPEGERRAALAAWLTDRRNPLTWRSVVNRVWQYHFGRGLVDSPNDFGRMGQLPTHPELLDWLAAEFRDGGQSLKALHRLLVTSAVYRQASGANEAFAQKDANNLYLGRMNRRRLEAEAIRDAVLAVSDKLDRQMGGPGFQDFVIDKPEHSPHYEYDRHDPEDRRSHRRSVYRFIVRSQQQPFLTTLDCADPSLAVDKRNETLTALQALALLNNKFMLAMSRHFAARVERSGGDLSDQVTAAFRLATGRAPTHAEAAGLTEYARQHGLANACRVLFNLNEFVFVD